MLKRFASLSARATLSFAVLSAAIFTSGCSSMLYHPTFVQHYDPAQVGLTAEDVYFPTSDGSKLHGWYFKSSMKKTKGLIVFFHGNGQNLSSHFASLSWIPPYGYDYFIFDYRGYGKSEGTASPENTVLDGIAAIRKGRDLAHGLPLVVFAQSLGGAVALRSLIEMKKEVPIRLLVLDSAFESYQGAGQGVLSHAWLTWPFQPLAYVLLSDKWSADGRVKELAPTPIVVMHGDHDQTIDYDLGVDVFQAAAEPKEFWKIEGGRHTDAFWRHGTTYREKFLKRLDQAVLAPAK